MNDVKWIELNPEEPYFFFVPKDFSAQKEYEKGFKIDELMRVNVSGIKTQRDDASIFMTETEMKTMTVDFRNLSVEELKLKYDFRDVRDWQVNSAKSDLQKNELLANRIFYRPFDNRWMLYTGQTKGIQGYPRFEIMRHLISRSNVSMVVCKQQSTFDFQHVFCSSLISDINSVSLQSKEISYVFPLYLYSNDGEIRVPNLDKEIWSKINTEIREETTPEDLFDYIYAVLHSPNYRAKYKEFLKIDFPKIPYPGNVEEYHHLANIGSQLRMLHLMENVPPTKHAQFNNPGNNIVDKPEYKGGNVWINKEQCFEDVPETAWSFYIGGYQPAQKWLKDRKGRTLTFDDIAHYRKIITVLQETDRLMKEIDEKEQLS